MSETSVLPADRRRRLRWRSRRGLLENDLVLTRFLDAHEATLTEEDVQGLDELLELTDNELMDVLLARKELNDELAGKPAVCAVLARLRSS